MKQEVQVTLTLEVDVTQSKSDIRDFIEDMINTHTMQSSTHNRMLYFIQDNFEIKEEAEIYKNI